MQKALLPLAVAAIVAGCNSTIEPTPGALEAETVVVTRIVTQIVEVPAPDPDEDGYDNEQDAFPLKADEWLDSDGDGIGNNQDNDDDGDGALDSNDFLPLNPTEWADFDGDGIGDNSDLDVDGDGVANLDDAFIMNASEWSDFDGDGVGDNADTDDDGDGAPDHVDLDPYNAMVKRDSDGDGVANSLDNDIDGDGYGNDQDKFPYLASEWSDIDNDGIGDNSDVDHDNDGAKNTEDPFPFDSSEWLDTDGDGIGNMADTDDDNDGVPDSQDSFPLLAAYSKDFDRDGLADAIDDDNDNDGLDDHLDAFPFSAQDRLDTDGDGISDRLDSDDDNDGVLDALDASPLDPANSTAPKWMNTAQPLFASKQILFSKAGITSTVLADIDDDLEPELLYGTLRNRSMGILDISDQQSTDLPLVQQAHGQVVPIVQNGQSSLLVNSSAAGVRNFNWLNGRWQETSSDFFATASLVNFSPVTELIPFTDESVIVRHADDQVSARRADRENYRQQAYSYYCGTDYDVTSATLFGQPHAIAACGSGLKMSSLGAFYSSSLPTLGNYSFDQKIYLHSTLHAEDILGDANDEIIASLGTELVLVQVNLNGAESPFAVSTIASNLRGVSAITTLDTNRDGQLDIAVGNEQGEVTLYLQDNGQFSVQSLPLVLGSIQDLQVFDVDKDGRQDLLAVDSTGIYWSRSQAPLSFSVGPNDLFVGNIAAQDDEQSAITYTLVRGEGLTVDATSGDIHLSSPASAVPGGIITAIVSASDGHSIIELAIEVVVSSAP